MRGLRLVLPRLVLPLIAAVFVLSLGPLALAETPKFQLTVSPSEIRLGETVTATVSIEIPGLAGPERYWAPLASDFRQRDSQRKQSTESEIDPDLGQTLTTVVTYRYIFEPSTTGRLAIGPARMRLGGDYVETRERFVRVRPSRGTPQETLGLGHTDAEQLAAPGYVPPTGPRDDVFLFAVTDKKSVWLGEQFTVSWLLFTRGEVLRYEPTPPALDSLWSETLFEPKAFFKYSDARIGMKDYVVALVSKRAFFALEAGSQTIAPLEAKVSTVATSMSRGQALASNSLVIEVKALPAPPPQGFDPSYVGEFSVEASVDRSLVQAGEALTLTMVIEGQGALRRTRAPRLAFPGFEFESPRDFTERDTTVRDTVSARREYRYWTTPSLGGELSLPAISLAYFSPAEGRYKVAKTIAIGITVHGDPQAEQEASLRRAHDELAPDIRLQSTRDSVESRVLVDLHRRPWFWYLLLAPPGLFLGFETVLRVRSRMQRDTPRSRRSRARSLARQHVKAADVHRRGQRSGKYYGELSMAVHAHLDVWLGRPTRTMTREALRELLISSGMDEATVCEVEANLDDFDRERFAPSSIDEASMDRARASVEAQLLAIEKQLQPGTGTPR